MMYRCYLLDEADRIKVREHFEAESDAAAVERARAFLRHTGDAAAEIWVGSRLLARVNHDDPPMT